MQTDTVGRPGGTLRASSVSRSFIGVQALDGLTVDIEPGIIGFVGANGAGKSTFLRILLGLLEPTSGSVTVLGYDVRTQAMELRALVGYMPEHDCLPLDVSGTDFVTHMAQMSGLPFASARERAAEMLRHVGLHEERYRLIGTYSTGMKQRIKLAQALAHDPRLLLLDEPTNGLDPEGRDEMLSLVERTGREFGIAVVVTSHLLGEIERVCEYLLAIDGGKLQYAGSVSAFTKRSRRILVEIDDDVPEFAAQLRARGVEVDGSARALRIAFVDDDIYDVVRDVAASLSVPISRLEVTRHKLEELFRDQAPEVQHV